MAPRARAARARGNPAASMGRELRILLPTRALPCRRSGPRRAV